MCSEEALDLKMKKRFRSVEDNVKAHEVSTKVFLASSNESLGGNLQTMTLGKLRIDF